MTYSKTNNDDLAYPIIHNDDAYAYINDLDLNYIVEIMCAASYSLPRWSLADAKHCLQLYKNFLVLLKENPREELVPTREIDEFWHNHILHTKNYHRDCLNIFGHYLHHEPASPSDDPVKLVSNYQKTKAYYLEKFSQPLALIQSTNEKLMSRG